MKMSDKKLKTVFAYFEKELTGCHVDERGRDDLGIDLNIFLPSEKTGCELRIATELLEGRSPEELRGLLEQWNVAELLRNEERIIVTEEGPQ